jgi:fructose-bisphosphate aldolase, class II
LNAVGLTRAAQILNAARAGGYAIPAFNSVNLETAQAIVRAAELEHAPVILQISENAMRYAGLGLMAAIACELRQTASVPVIVHFDHAETIESARAAIEHGFDMVMLEGDDVNVLRALADFAHMEGAALEAEYEVVSKGDRGETQAELDGLEEFVRTSNCDALAVAIGSAHKQTDKTSALDFVKLEQLANLTRLPLVLHGASGVLETDLQRAVTLGIAKVNVATELALVFTDAVREQLENSKLNDPRKYLGAARDAMTERARAVIRLLGASGKANARETVSA